METVSSVSLAGGQGKTTLSLFVARMLAERGNTVLVIDADPQSSLTTFLGHQVEPDSPTLLEVLKKQVNAEDGIYKTRYENLFLIPSDDALDTVQDYLAGSGTGAFTLKRRLSPVTELFDYCIVDAPPQRSQICLSVIGASKALMLPVEASVKGLQSLIRTLELINELQEDQEAFDGTLLGVIPFRDRWVGLRRTTESDSNIESMRQITQEWFNKDFVLPSIRESEKFKQAINRGKTLYEMGQGELAYPIEVLVEKIAKLGDTL
ncbi:Chromosome (plasmid) partitioning protein ParA [uncultured Synechococcales cyanobacterium]|uniref:Chromosome (Plasmid) partitioning protein ParA n=1 Tax=uncultured Synechococcales cyanobacterium TaxID=1936017 RepID=A0A6J4V2R9_9CYAN|nr:Chromosome (plasmid) partitioning protein ParA [uncultured Synechococcales cyanobacterium]